jgi:integrase
MASVRKKGGSKYWFGCFVMPDGRRVQRSTKSKDKMEALQIALSWEKATRQRATVEQSKKVIASIVKIVHGDVASDESVSTYFDRWVKRKAVEVGKNTADRYKNCLENFTTYLGSRANNPLAEIVATDLAKWRDGLASKIAPGTVNVYLKVVRSAFRDAHAEGAIVDSPARAIKLLKRSVSEKSAVASTRRAFTEDELQKTTAQIPEDSEWRGMFLAGIFTGQRLSDIAHMSKTDLKDGWWRFRVKKTGRAAAIPLAKPLADWLDKHCKTVRGQYVFPSAVKTIERSNGLPGTLSNQFRRYLELAGVVEYRKHRSQGIGRGGKRSTGGLSFHCLRHTTNTLLKTAGVQESVAMDFVGHESESISRLYTHVPEESLLAAVRKLEKALG